MKFSFPFTAKQRELVEHRAKILWVGTSTKTGKSQASYVWLVEGMMNAQNCCFCGPWFYRSKNAYDLTKDLLKPLIAARKVRSNEARLQLISSTGGTIDFVSADNPNALFGSNFHRLVIDEASRCPQQIHGAGLTTVSATGGRIRLLFNLELGVKNWAVSNLLRVQKMSAEERERTSEDYMTFPFDPTLVPASLVETLRGQMPESLWRALYLAEIPQSDSSLFRNLDRIFGGRELVAPAEDKKYFMGLDLGRKSDYTVAVVVDEDGNVVASDRFHEISWSLQCSRVAELYRRFNCLTCVYDQTGIGDPVGESLEEAGLHTEGFIITQPSRKLLIEELVLSCDRADISVPASDRFKIFRAEMESMEYTLDGLTIRYSVPSGSHDDCIFALALAVRAFRQNKGAILGLLDLLKKTAKQIGEGIRDAYGELIHKPEPKARPVLVRGPVEAKPPVVVDNFKVWQATHKAPPCPACHATCTTYNAARKILCNQCGCVDGQTPTATTQCGCDNPLLVVVGGRKHCNQCAWDEPPPATVPLNGVPRKSA
ncbi:MAG TPA: hypothetical protein VGI46_06870 [Candidatus Acidoferrum sp.]|jgi:hypothetical protein